MNRFLSFIQMKVFYNISIDMKEEDYLYFAEELHEIMPRTIPTSFGDIYSLTAGIPGQPLILVVHGSGPKNSADTYAYLLHEYLVRISYIEKFYIVAIDCPGYGRSKGSKQAVKTFPLKMFKEILEGLNYRNYFAMLGHSQGGAAIFNAVHQDPTITDCLIMDRPVCGNIQRFRGFLMPTLLIYDIEDDGHPIWQGKLLYKELKNTEFYTYRSSHHPFWVPDNIWQKMISFFSRMYRKERKLHFAIEGDRKNKSYSKPKSQSLSKQRRKKIKNLSVDKCKEIQKKQSKIEEIERSELMSVASRKHSSSDAESLEEKPDLRRRRSSQLQEEDIPLPPPRKIQERVIFEAQEIKETPQIQAEKDVETVQITAQKKPMTAEELLQEHKCAICYQTLFRPVVTNCNHVFCNKCLLQSLLVNEKCPLCRGKIIKKTADKQLHQKLISKLSPKEVTRREQDFQKIQRMLKSIVYIEIGNTSRELETKQSAFTKTKKKYIWELFVKQPRGFGIEEVGFNINMGESASRPIKVRSAPFTFESRGTFSFACQITIKPKSNEYAQTKEIYRIDVQPGYHSKKVALRKKCYLKG